MRRTEFIKMTVLSALAGCSGQPDEAKKAVRLEMLVLKDSLSAKCRLLKQAGFAGIELNSASYDLSEVKRACRQSSLKVVSVENTCNWSKPLNHPDKQVRKDAVDSVIKAIEEASALKADFVNVLPGVRVRGMSYEEGFKKTLESLRKVLPLLKSSGVRLVLQNKTAGFIESTAQMSEILKALNNPLTGVCFDPANVLKNESVSYWKQALEEKIFMKHLRNFSQESQIDCLWHILDGYGGSLNRLKAKI